MAQPKFVQSLPMVEGIDLGSIITFDTSDTIDDKGKLIEHKRKDGTSYNNGPAITLLHGDLQYASGTRIRWDVIKLIASLLATHAPESPLTRHLVSNINTVGEMRHTMKPTAGSGRKVKPVRTMNITAFKAALAKGTKPAKS